MRRVIKISVLLGMLVLAAVFFFASFAQADPGRHSHPHHQTKAVSPFDKVSSDKPLHCLLNAHLHKTKEECPHNSSHPDKGKSAEFRADCGSNPINSEGSSFGGDLLKHTNTDGFTYNLDYKFLIPQTNDKISLLPRSFEHPPQLS